MESVFMRAAREVVHELTKHGHRALIAGGAVRDRLLGREPEDVDVATSATPDEVQEVFRQTRLVGASFGVVLVQVEETWIEVATFRTEGPYLDGRRPSTVSFSSPEEDVRRRDFTVNGLFMEGDTLEVVDLVGGVRDLEARTLRAIGDPRERFAEDHLRLLRAVRLSAKLDFDVEPSTWEAVRDMAPLVTNVSAERIRVELVKLLTTKGATRGLRLLHESRIMEAILPEVARGEGVEQPPEFHPEGDVLTHTILLFEHLDRPSPELAMGALLHDVGKPVTQERGHDGRMRFPRHARVGAELADDICARLRFSNNSREQITSLVENHMKFADVKAMRTSTLKRFLQLPNFDEHLDLHRADCLSSHRDLDHWEFVRQRRNELGEETIRPTPLVNGHDLIALGWQGGVELGRELAKLDELQLADEISTREEALKIAREDLRAGNRPNERPPHDGGGPLQ